MTLPPAAELIADAAWRRIDFISDLHLSPEIPLTVKAWADYMRATPADAVFILGDLFEVWVGDDSRFEGFEAQCLQVLQQTAEQRPLFFMAGNRDFLVGAEMLAACHIEPLRDPTILVAFNQRYLLTHGDALCLDDVEYQKFRRIVRSAEWQAGFLAKPLDERRRYAREVRSQSEMRKQGASPAEWADVDSDAAVLCLDQAGSQTLIHGHTHRPATEELPGGRTRHVLSDWELDLPPFRAEVLRMDRHGVRRLGVSDALA